MEETKPLKKIIEVLHRWCVESRHVETFCQMVMLCSSRCEIKDGKWRVISGIQSGKIFFASWRRVYEHTTCNYSSATSLLNNLPWNWAKRNFSFYSHINRNWKFKKWSRNYNFPYALSDDSIKMILMKNYSVLAKKKTTKKVQQMLNDKLTCLIDLYEHQGWKIKNRFSFPHKKVTINIGVATAFS